MRLGLLMLCAVGLWSVVGRAQGSMEHQQHYPHISTEVLFENDRVLVQKYVVQPCRSSFSG